MEMDLRRWTSLNQARGCVRRDVYFPFLSRL